MNSQSNSLKEQSVLHLIAQNNFIIPEIQREYVWGDSKNIGVLKDFLKNIQTKAGLFCDSCGNPNTNEKINIGFLYTYKPNYVTIERHRYLDANLIDGQQRFTSLFLLLFYLSIKENKLDDFKELIRADDRSSMCFSYKVRNLTHLFLNELISKANTLSVLQNIKSQTWYLKDYEEDISINSIVRAIETIDNQFSGNIKLYNFVLNNVKFWHFKTEATSQGEELYITMNARGEALSGYEIAKASLMLKNENIVTYGKEWEEWQDFFWKIRNKNTPNSNADKGFNEFLRWITIIEMININSDIEDDDNESTKEKNIVELIKGETKFLPNSEYLSMDLVKEYFDALVHIKTINVGQIANSFFNSYFDLGNRVMLSQQECFKFLPILFYVKEFKSKNIEISDRDILRLGKFLQNLTLDVTVTKTINKQCINAVKLVSLLAENDTVDIAKSIEVSQGYKSILNNDERFKFAIYLNKDIERIAIEELFWKAEAHKLNKGKLGHLIQASYTSLEEIDNFNFSNIFENYNVEDFDFNKWSNLYHERFLKLCPYKDDDFNSLIYGCLTQTGYYKASNYGEFNKYISCISSAKDRILKSKYFLKWLFESHNSPEDLYQEYKNNAIASYDNLVDLQAESDVKKQLFIYFILFKESGKYWKWSYGLNFGLLSNNGCKSLFDHKFIFQHYRERWGGAEYNNVELDNKIINTAKNIFNN